LGSPGQKPRCDEDATLDDAAFALAKYDRMKVQQVCAELLEAACIQFCIERQRGFDVARSGFFGPHFHRPKLSLANKESNS
jgi:hypothetical protein